MDLFGAQADDVREEAEHRLLGVTVGGQRGCRLQPRWGVGLWSWGLVERAAAKWRAASCGSKCAGRPVAVGKDVDWSSMLLAKLGGDDGNVVVFLIDRVLRGVAAGTAPSPVHRRHAPAFDEGWPDRFPCFDAAHAAVDQQ